MTATNQNDTRIFDICNNRPKLLLLGSGILKAYYKADSWNKILKNIRDKNTKKKYPLEIDRYDMPWSFKMEMFNIENNYENDGTFLYKISNLDKSSSPLAEKLAELNLDFILTTNYTYEIECALWENRKEIRLSELFEHKFPKNSQDSIITRHYNLPPNKSKQCGIYHIHGEVISTNNKLMISNYRYGELLHECMKHLQKNVSPIDSGKLTVESWVDAFIWGDVYILGVDMDFSKTDLWWLLQYKSDIQESNNNYERGKTVFFNTAANASIEGSEEWCKIEMLRNCHVIIENIESHKLSPDFYDQSFEIIAKDLQESEGKTEH